MRGLIPQTLTIPLAAGLAQKADPRALEAPGLSRLVDGQFDELGGIQTRYPYGNVMGSVTDARRIVQNGDELLCFTKTELLSWNAAASTWVSKGTHLAIRVEESAAFATTGDQICADRAELGGTIVYAWEDNAAVYAGVVNASTGAVILGPTAVGTGTRPKLVALSTKILLFFRNTAGINVALSVLAIDPASPAAGLAATPTALLTGGDFNTYYDACRVPGADTAAWACRRTTTTSYQVGTVTAALVTTASTKARACDGPIAVSCPPTGTHIQVIRANGTNIQGDYLTLALADVATGQAVGTASGTVNQIAAAHRSVVDDSAYRCYAFWSSAEASGVTDWQSKTNWVDTNDNLGTQATFVRRLGVASRAFDRDGRVFVWMAFAGESSFSGANYSEFRAQLQNSYFLYRDDATLHAKAAFQRAGGFAANTGHLPTVQNTSGSTYAWCGVERRVIALGLKQSGYGARAPRDITFTFDSDEARRCARLGQTLYITGGELMQYDGVQLTEVGFHVYPWYFGAIEVGTGNLEDGTYAIKNTLRWDNARGELDRSTTATVGTVTIAGGPNGISIVSWTPVYVTHKTGVAVEVWRTAKDPTPDAPFYLVTSKDPAATSNPNRYIANGTGATLDTFNDELADEDATSNESSNENGGVLEPLAPPAATIIAASADRLFLAGIAGAPNEVWYSRLRGDNEVASFHDNLRVTIPRDGGDITALAFLNETLIVFKETAIYALPGDGYDNLGGGGNYGPARLLSADVGAASAEAVALMPAGLLFKSSKGWYLLNRGWSVEYVGAAVCDYDAEAVVAVHVLETQHQVRCLTASRMLVWDYLAQQWAEWSVSNGIHAAMWNGTHHYLTGVGPKPQLTTYTGVDYGLDIETAWVPLGAPGWGRVWKLLVLGEYRSACRVRVRLARNYSDTYFQDKSWPPSPTTVGGPLQFKHGPSVQEMEAIKIRITAIHTEDDEGGDPTPPTGEALKLTRLSLEVGLERGVRPLRAAQVQ